VTVVVSFVTPKGVGSINAPGIGAVRVREDIALDGTTTATVQDGEVVLIGNAESDMVAVAFGTTPDPDATAATAATSAGVPVGAGQIGLLCPKPADKIAAKALA